MPETKIEVDIRQIEPGDKFTGFSVGDDKFLPLKIFLKKHAHRFQNTSLARTYGAFNASTQKAIGYVTLVCGEVVVQNGDENLVDDAEYRYPHYPAVKIARLAIHSGHRGNGLGRVLVDLSLGVAKDTICPAVGCRFLMVDSKREAVDFYVKCGFTLLDTAANKERDEPVMFVDLHKLPYAI